MEDSQHITTPPTSEPLHDPTRVYHAGRSHPSGEIQTLTPTTRAQDPPCAMLVDANNSSSHVLRSSPPVRGGAVDEFASDARPLFDTVCRASEVVGEAQSPPHHQQFANHEAGDWIDIYADLFADSNQGEPSGESHDSDSTTSVFSFRGAAVDADGSMRLAAEQRSGCSNSNSRDRDGGGGGRDGGESEDLGLLSFLRGGMSRVVHFPTSESAPSGPARGEDAAMWMASWGAHPPCSVVGVADARVPSHAQTRTATQRPLSSHKDLAPLPLTESIMQGNPPPSLLAAWRRANAARGEVNDMADELAKVMSCAHLVAKSGKEMTPKLRENIAQAESRLADAKERMLAAMREYAIEIEAARDGYELPSERGEGCVRDDECEEGEIEKEHENEGDNAADPPTEGAGDVGKGGSPGVGGERERGRVGGGREGAGGGDGPEAVEHTEVTPFPVAGLDSAREVPNVIADATGIASADATTKTTAATMTKIGAATETITPQGSSVDSPTDETARSSPVDEAREPSPAPAQAQAMTSIPSTSMPDENGSGRSGHREKRKRTGKRKKGPAPEKAMGKRKSDNGGRNDGGSKGGGKTDAKRKGGGKVKAGQEPREDKERKYKKKKKKKKKTEKTEKKDQKETKKKKNNNNKKKEKKKKNDHKPKPQETRKEPALREGHKGKSPRHKYRYATTLISPEGPALNPVEFSAMYDYVGKRPTEEPVTYWGNALHSTPDVLVVALQPPPDDPRLGVHWDPPITLQRSSLLDLKWRFPVHEVGEDGVEYHIIPPTPREVYTIELPNDKADLRPEDVGVEYHVRTFICPKPCPSLEVPVAISMRASRGDLGGSADLLRQVLLMNELEVAVSGSAATPENPSGVETICDARDVKEGIHVHMSVRFEYAVAVRQALEAYEFVVVDEYYHHRGLWIFYQEPSELRKRAAAHVDTMSQRLSEGHKQTYGEGVSPSPAWLEQAEKAIAFSVRPPLRTYVIEALNEKGSSFYTDKYIERYREKLYDRGPLLSAAQTTQALDAYYWTHLAPPAQRVDYSDVIQFYWAAGRTVRLKNPHTITGQNRGRTSFSGLKRVYSGASARRHMMLPSRYLEITPTGEEQAKNRVKPRSNQGATVGKAVPEEGSDEAPGGVPISGADDGVASGGAAEADGGESSTPEVRPTAVRRVDTDIPPRSPERVVEVKVEGGGGGGGGGGAGTGADMDVVTEVGAGAITEAETHGGGRRENRESAIAKGGAIVGDIGARPRESVRDRFGDGKVKREHRPHRKVGQRRRSDEGEPEVSRMRGDGDGRAGRDRVHNVTRGEVEGEGVAKGGGDIREGATAEEYADGGDSGDSGGGGGDGNGGGGGGDKGGGGDGDSSGDDATNIGETICETTAEEGERTQKGRPTNTLSTSSPGRTKAGSLVAQACTNEPSVAVPLPVDPRAGESRSTADVPRPDLAVATRCGAGGGESGESGVTKSADTSEASPSPSGESGGRTSEVAMSLGEGKRAGEGGTEGGGVSENCERGYPHVSPGGDGPRSKAGRQPSPTPSVIHEGRPESPADTTANAATGERLKKRRISCSAGRAQPRNKLDASDVTARSRDPEVVPEIGREDGIVGDGEARGSGTPQAPHILAPQRGGKEAPSAVPPVGSGVEGNGDGSGNPPPLAKRKRGRPPLHSREGSIDPHTCVGKGAMGPAHKRRKISLMSRVGPVAPRVPLVQKQTGGLLRFIRYGSDPCGHPPRVSVVGAVTPFTVSPIDAESRGGGAGTEAAIALASWSETHPSLGPLCAVRRLANDGARSGGAREGDRGSPTRRKCPTEDGGVRTTAGQPGRAASDVRRKATRADRRKPGTDARSTPKPTPIPARAQTQARVPSPAPSSTSTPSKRRFEGPREIDESAPERKRRKKERPPEGKDGKRKKKDKKKDKKKGKKKSKKKKAKREKRSKKQKKSKRAKKSLDGGRGEAGGVSGFVPGNAVAGASVGVAIAVTMAGGGGGGGGGSPGLAEHGRGTDGARQVSAGGFGKTERSDVDDHSSDGEGRSTEEAEIRRSIAALMTTQCYPGALGRAREHPLGLPGLPSMKAVPVDSTEKAELAVCPYLPLDVVAEVAHKAASVGGKPRRTRRKISGPRMPVARDAEAAHGGTASGGTGDLTGYAPHVGELSPLLPSLAVPAPFGQMVPSESASSGGTMMSAEALDGNEALRVGFADGSHGGGVLGGLIGSVAPEITTDDPHAYTGANPDHYYVPDAWRGMDGPTMPVAYRIHDGAEVGVPGGECGEGGRLVGTSTCASIVSHVTPDPRLQGASTLPDIGAAGSEGEIDLVELEEALRVCRASMGDGSISGGGDGSICDAGSGYGVVMDVGVGVGVGTPDAIGDGVGEHSATEGHATEVDPSCWEGSLLDIVSIASPHSGAVDAFSFVDGLGDPGALAPPLASGVPHRDMEASPANAHGGSDPASSSTGARDEPGASTIASRPKPLTPPPAGSGGERRKSGRSGSRKKKRPRPGSQSRSQVALGCFSQHFKPPPDPPPSVEDALKELGRSKRTPPMASNN